MKNRILFILFSSILFLSCNQKNDSVFNDGTIAHFCDFRGNNVLNGNNSLLACDKFEYPVNIATENLDFVAKVKLNTFSVFGLCRLDFEGKGTMLLVNDSIVEINRVDTLKGSNIYTFKLPFRIKENGTYIIRLYKENKNVCFSIMSENNELYVNEAIYSEDNDFGRNWGNPSVFCLGGSIEVMDAFLRNSVYNKPSLGIFGDSFIEGWGVIDNLDKRYVALLEDILGNENTYISGRGGETTTTLLSRFDAELTSIKSNYVLLAIGTNDTDFSTYKTNIETLISKVKSSNKTPILVTITPRLGFPIQDINNYVRNRGELFIDMNKAVNNGSETSWNPLFVNSDNIHPNIAGNKTMFHKVLFDLYFLFNTKDIYNKLK